MTFSIEGRPIGDGSPCFIIAEAGVNHNGSLDLAKQLVDVAVAARADAVKFQTFAAERLTARHAPKADYQLKTTDVGESQLDMLRRLELPESGFRTLFDYCRERGILFLSTPFDEQSAELLERIGVSAFKISSGEATNLPFLEHVSRMGKPIILSTGMCSIGEVESAVRAIEACGNEQIAILHCVSNYPAKAEEVNLRTMKTLELAFGKPVGYSDHTRGLAVPIASVALGACIVEKHFTTSRDLPGPDQTTSLEPDELQALVSGIREVERALGGTRKTPTAAELNTASVARKSLVAARPIAAGETIDRSMIVAKRPGTGLSPAFLTMVIGRRVRRPLASDEMIRWEDLEASVHA